MHGYIKLCSECKEVKSGRDFYFAANARDNLMGRCKECHKTYTADKAKKKLETVDSSRRSVMYLVKAAKARAKRNGLRFNLTPEIIVIPELCPIFGVKLEIGHRDNAPSIDRVDNTRGYTRDNICIMSVRANRIKNNGSALEHRQISDWMYKVLDKSV